MLPEWGWGVSHPLLLSYAYDIKKLESYVNQSSDISLGNWWNFMIKILVPLVLLVLLGTEIYRRTYSSYGSYPRAAESLGGYGLLAFFLILSIIFMKKRTRVFA